jgi:hypothetical protein
MLGGLVFSDEKSNNMDSLAYKFITSLANKNKYAAKRSLFG